MTGNGSDRVSRSHHHDGGSVFSSEMAVTMGHGNTVPDWIRRYTWSLRPPLFTDESSISLEPRCHIRALLETMCARNDQLTSRYHLPQDTNQTALLLAPMGFSPDSQEHELVQLEYK